MTTITSETHAFLSIMTEAPKPKDRRRSRRAPAGTLAILRQIVNAEELSAIHVLVIDVSDGGLGLRSPIALTRGGTYRVNTEKGEKEDSWQVKVVSSRRRRDGSYDIGTRHV